MNPSDLIDKYCAGNTELRRILLIHSRQVADRALRIARRNPQLDIDLVFLEEAALLHDIGVVLCDAPGIACHGTEPYIRHGILGAELLRAEGLPLHARVCERHTGTGLTCAAILARNLPLPPCDFVPETWAEQVICYADKFYSKSHPEREKSPEQTLRSLGKFGVESVSRFREWMRCFGENEDFIHLSNSKNNNHG